jgi:DNA-binding protein HU-beta
MQGGKKISLVGFGSFEVGARAARTGRHPQTGQPMEIAASKVVKFKGGKKLKDAVNV